MYYYDNNTEHHKVSLTLYIHRHCQILGQKQEAKETKIFIVFATIICNNYPEKAVLTDYWGRPIKT